MPIAAFGNGVTGAAVGLGDMIEDGLEAAFGLAREQVPSGVVAVWALAGVVVVLLIAWRRHDLGLKIGVSLLVVGSAAWAVLWSSLQLEAQYYKFVDEVMAQAETFRQKRLRLQVHGCVVRGSIERRVGTDEYRFRLESRGDRAPAELEARYIGLLPDTFRSGAEIVARGRLTADGWLDVVPDGIMAKCPSKYDSSIGPEWQCAEPGS